MSEIDINSNSVGSYLKSQRISQQITLQEVAEITKVSLRFLEAIEADEFSTLPGEAFCRGFIKVYAKYLGLDQQKVVALYEHFRFGKPYIEHEEKSEKLSHNFDYGDKITDGVKSLKKNKVLKQKQNQTFLYISIIIIGIIILIASFRFLADYIEKKANQSMQNKQQSSISDLMKTIEPVKPDGIMVNTPALNTETPPSTTQVTKDENVAEVTLQNTQVDVANKTETVKKETEVKTPENQPNDPNNKVEPVTTNEYSTLSVKVKEALYLKVVSDGKTLKEGKFEANTLFNWRFSTKIQLLTTSDLNKLDMVFNNTLYPAPTGDTDSRKYREFIHEKD